MSQWYYARQGQRSGPVLTEQFKELASSGQILPSDSVWKKGMEKWVPAGSLKGLFPNSALSDVPPPPPPVAPAAGGTFCRNCGAAVAEQAVACMTCGLAPTNGAKFCRSCGAETNPAAVVCVKCGVSTKGVVAKAGGGSSGGMVQPSDPPKDPVLMCVLSVLIAGLGQIILGQTAKGITILLAAFLVTAVTCGWGLPISAIIMVIFAVDAYKIANKLKQGSPVGSWDCF